MGKSFWILDSSHCRTYDVKEEIKAKGGKWNKDFGCWEITTDDEETINLFKRLGVRLQLKIKSGVQNVDKTRYE